MTHNLQVSYRRSFDYGKLIFGPPLQDSSSESPLDHSNVTLEANVNAVDITNVVTLTYNQGDGVENQGQHPVGYSEHLVKCSLALCMLQSAVIMYHFRMGDLVTHSY